MEFLFYIWATIALIWEMMAFSSSKKVASFKANMIKASENDTEKTDSMKAYSLFSILYFMWSLVGLFTSQYLIFLILILIAFLPKKKAWTIRLDALVSIILLLLVIMNKYHWHIDFTQVLFG